MTGETIVVPISAELHSTMAIAMDSTTGVRTPARTNALIRTIMAITAMPTMGITENTAVKKRTGRSIGGDISRGIEKRLVDLTDARQFAA
jgi:hypothetical protein